MSEAPQFLAQRPKNPVYGGEPQWLQDSGSTGPVTLPMAFDPMPGE
jgi:hypothetical protein